MTGAACARCGAVLPAAGVCAACLYDADLPPVLLGGAIELEEEIGRGGMGTVYRAHHRGLGRRVAVKLLPPALAAQPSFRERFAREAQALGRLNHPHIVAVHDCGEQDGQPYIVMEYVDGQPLAAQLPLPAARAVAIAEPVCAALAYAHAHGVVHRDIKPDNILIGADGQVKVADFGIARLSGDDWTITAPQQTAGTPHYQAPEALAGAPPDPRMDLYALGVVLYQSISGELPLGTFAPLPGRIDGVVRRALAADPARRYRDADEMRHALRAAAPAGGRALPPDERTWIFAVALLQAISCAVALWALLLSLTPRVVAPTDVLPLIMLPGETLADGRIVSWARFETWPTLAALATFAIAISAYGALRLHWRRHGIEEHAPDRPIPEARWVLVLGLLSCALYAYGKLVAWEARPVSTYLPLIGGVIEIAALLLLWVGILEAWRCRRPLYREPALWLGFALAVVPPISEFFVYLARWQPT
jgi:serine/threonine-protein kinase